MTTDPAASAALLAEPPASPPSPPPPPPPPSPGSAGIEVFPVRFSGTGGGYFRVWIVNLVLLLLTLGAFTPWARRRTARWFYDHTEVAGSPLEFAAPMRRMVIGFVVFAGLYIAYEIASRTGQDAASLVMTGAAVALAPLVWLGAMRFRLASTRWRGLQLRLSADRRAVYRESWPAAAIAAIWAGAYWVLDTLASDDSAGAGSADSRFVEQALPLGAGAVVAVAVSIVLLARLEYGYRRLLFERGGLGDMPGRFKPAFGHFAWVSLAAFATWGVLLVAALGIVGMLVVDPSDPLSVLARRAGGSTKVAAMATVVAFPAFVVALTASVLAWREASVFAAVWNGVGLGRIMRTQCTLSTGRFVRLRLANVALTLLTLGLWRPFARVREYRMKVESVRLHVRGGLDGIEGRLQPRAGGVADMLADVAGFDLIG